MFTETAKDSAFDSLLKQRKLDDGRWRFRECEDGISLIAACDGVDAIAVAAGRQVVTREGLEVLALCCRQTFKDGEAIGATIDQVLNAGGVPVLPYGVGKWSGARGRVVDDVLNSEQSQHVCLGDNAGRLAIAGEPAKLSEARQHGVYTLHGTDPLPLASQANRAGRAATVLAGEFDRARPGDSLKRLIVGLSKQPDACFNGSGVINFLKLQLAMQVRKRIRRGG